MENDGASCFWDDPSATGSSVSPSDQSEWLRTTLSDLDDKMKGMMILLEHDNKAELKQNLDDVFTSYRSLAEKFDKLKSLSREVNHCKKLGISSDMELTSSDIQTESVVEDPDDDCEFDGATADHGFEHMNKLADDLITVEADKKLADNLLDGTMLSGISFQVTKLLHENLRQQAELLRRNKEKREEISKLRKQHPEEHQLNKPDICSIRHRQSLMRFAKVDAKRNRLKRFFSAGCSSFDSLI